MIKALLYALNAFVMILATGGIAAFQLGEWTPGSAEYGKIAVEKLAPALNDTPTPSRRVFILFIESLREETARHPEYMPYLSKFKDKTLHGSLSTVVDAATEPALIAAFTGATSRKALGALRVYFNPKGHIDSLFTIAKQYGLKTVVYSDFLTFSIFRRDFSERRQRTQDESKAFFDPSFTNLPSALDSFIQGDASLMIYHIDEMETIARRRGVHHQDYYETSQTIDQFIREIDERLSPEDYLLIFGDHGHTVQGRHSLGLDVPTFFALRGPGVINQELARAPISLIHYLLASVLRLPLSPFYEGPIIQGFQFPPASASLNPPQNKGPTSMPIRPLWSWYVAASMIGIVGLLWYRINEGISSFFVSRPRLKIKSVDRRQLLLLGCTILFSALVGIFFFEFGKLLAEFKFFLSDPPLHMINKFWLAALFIVLFNVPQRSPASLGLFIFLLPFFFLMPNFYRHGAPGVFAPAWILWVIGMGKLALEKKKHEGRAVSSSVPAIILFLLYILQLFFFAEGQKQTATWFTPLITEITPTSLFVRAVLGAFCGFFLIFRKNSSLWSKGLAPIFALYILLVQMHIISHGGLVELAVGAILVLAGVILGGPLKSGTYFKEPLHFPKAVYLIGLFILSAESLRLNLDARINLLMLFCAVRLSLILMDKILDPKRSRENHILFICLVGFVGLGWLTLGWGFSRLDWGPISEYVPPETVGRRIGHFLPIILVRFALPLVMLRTLLEEKGGVLSPFPARSLGLILGTKYLSLLLIILGIGLREPGSILYFEAVAQLGVFLILGFGFL